MSFVWQKKKKASKDIKVWHKKRSFFALTHLPFHEVHIVWINWLSFDKRKKKPRDNIKAWHKKKDATSESMLLKHLQKWKKNAQSSYSTSTYIIISISGPAELVRGGGTTLGRAFPSLFLPIYKREYNRTKNRQFLILAPQNIDWPQYFLIWKRYFYAPPGIW